MKREIGVGEDYALTKHKHKQFNIRYISLLAVLTTMCLYAVKQVSAQQAEPAATAVIGIKPLQIGDTIPEYLWQMPLQVVNHPEGKDTITLQQYKNRQLIMLDFWSTTCASCIIPMTKMDSMQNRFGGEIAILPVTYQDANTVLTAFKHNKHLRNVQLLTLVEDEVLAQVFKHRTIPHIVWLNTSGVIVATTLPRYVDSQHISRVLEGQQLSPRIMKEGWRNYERDHSLLYNWEQTFAVHDPHPLSSSLTGPFKGVGREIAFEPDSARKLIRTRILNMPVYQMYLLAFGKPVNFPKSQIILAVADSTKYMYYPEWGYRDEWEQLHAMCYESVLPIGKGESGTRVRLAQDLDAFSGVIGKLEKKAWPCLVMKKSKEVKPQNVNGSSGVFLKTLVGALNNLPDGTPVFDETGYSGRININIENLSSASLPRIKTQLAKQGIELIPAVREVELLTLTEQTL